MHTIPRDLANLAHVLSFLPGHMDEAQKLLSVALTVTESVSVSWGEKSVVRTGLALGRGAETLAYLQRFGFDRDFYHQLHTTDPTLAEQYLLHRANHPTEIEPTLYSLLLETNHPAFPAMQERVQQAPFSKLLSHCRVSLEGHSSTVRLAYASACVAAYNTERRGRSELYELKTLPAQGNVRYPGFETALRLERLAKDEFFLATDALPMLMQPDTSMLAETAVTLMVHTHPRLIGLIEIGHYYLRSGHADKAAQIASEVESGYTRLQAIPGNLPPFIAEQVAEFISEANGIPRASPVNETRLAYSHLDAAVSIRHTLLAAKSAGQEFPHKDQTIVTAENGTGYPRREPDALCHLYATCGYPEEATRYLRAHATRLAGSRAVYDVAKAVAQFGDDALQWQFLEALIKAPISNKSGPITHYLEQLQAQARLTAFTELTARARDIIDESA